MHCGLYSANIVQSLHRSETLLQSPPNETRGGIRKVNQYGYAGFVQRSEKAFGAYKKENGSDKKLPRISELNAEYAILLEFCRVEGLVVEDWTKE